MDRYLKERDAANVLNRKPATLRTWRVIGKGPVWVKDPEGAIHYKEADLKEWMDAERNHQQDA